MLAMTRSSTGGTLAAARGTMAAAIRSAAFAVTLAVPLAGTPAGAATFGATLTGWIEVVTRRAEALEAGAPAPLALIGDGPLLKTGERGDRVWLLAHRLFELGFLTPGDLTSAFDRRVDAGVRAFQRANELRDDGIVGPGTVAALDRSPRESIELLRRTASEMTALRDEGVSDALFVNLPSQTVTVVRGGELLWTMRSIVGKPERETPLLWDQITHVIINPTWTVPPTVMTKDKLPNLRRTGKPGISNATIYLDGAPVADPERVDWSTVTPGRLRIVQAPGDDNALGRFRFNLTNPYSIYLHGTNQPHLFKRDLRTISSGCVRLEDARRLAEMLLTENGVSVERIDRYLESGKPRWVKLAKPLAVRFTYWMATVNPDGGVRMHPDVYEFGDGPLRIAAFPRSTPVAATAPEGNAAPEAAPTAGAPTTTEPASSPAVATPPRPLPAVPDAASDAPSPTPRPPAATPPTPMPSAPMPSVAPAAAGPGGELRGDGRFGGAVRVTATDDPSRPSVGDESRRATTTAPN